MTARTIHDSEDWKRRRDQRTTMAMKDGEDWLRKNQWRFKLGFRNWGKKLTCIKNTIKNHKAQILYSKGGFPHQSRCVWNKTLEVSHALRSEIRSVKMKITTARRCTGGICFNFERMGGEKKYVGEKKDEEEWGKRCLNTLRVCSESLATVDFVEDRFHILLMVDGETLHHLFWRCGWGIPDGKFLTSLQATATPILGTLNPKWFVGRFKVSAWAFLTRWWQEM